MNYAQAVSCNYMMKDAVVSLKLENNLNVKIISKESCKGEEFLADRFYDAEIEFFKGSKRIGKFYSRHLTYNPSEGKILFKSSSLVDWYKEDTKSKNKLSRDLLIFDAKKRVFQSDLGMIKII